MKAMGKRKRMGRPPKKASEKYSRTVCVKVTQAEYRALRAEAKRRGVTLSALLLAPWRKGSNQKGR